MRDEFNFERLLVYQKALVFVTDIYTRTQKFPSSEMYGLVSQLRRASISIVSNISEGSGRRRVEFGRFLEISRGSVFECVAQLKISLNLNYIDQKEYELFYERCVELSKMISKLKSSLKTPHS